MLLSLTLTTFAFPWPEGPGFETRRRAQLQGECRVISRAPPSRHARFFHAAFDFLKTTALQQLLNGRAAAIE